MPLFLGSHRYLGFSGGFASPLIKQNRTCSLAGPVSGPAEALCEGQGRAGQGTRTAVIVPHPPAASSVPSRAHAGDDPLHTARSEGLPSCVSHGCFICLALNSHLYL